MTNNNEPSASPTEDQVTLRSPAELADSLPYLMGFHPDDSVVLLALHGERGRFGGRLRLGIPRLPEQWPDVADQLARCLVAGSAKREEPLAGIVVFLCQDPADGESDTVVMERLRPLAQELRVACGGLDVPVVEALCISRGRFWSYCCPDARCCPPEGTPLSMPGTSVMAAAASYAGIEVRGSLREMEAGLAPLGGPVAQRQETALDAAAGALVPRIVGGDRAAVGAETLALVADLLVRFRDAPPPRGRHAADAQDDALITDGEAARILLGLQDRTTRDVAAEWMEAPQAEPALRAWRALARRCVGAYADHAAAPLTLAGWVAWSLGDEPAARVALGMALRTDPDYLFARLLHQAANEGLDPEQLRRCLRSEREARTAAEGDGDGCASGEVAVPSQDRRSTREAGGPSSKRRPEGRAGRAPRRGTAGTRPASSRTALPTVRERSRRTRSTRRCR